MKFSDKFIMATDRLCDFDNPVAAPYFRKKFELDFMPEKAEITICGLGFYELYINGENITKGYLAPYISNVNHIKYYDNYDISDKLKNGENTIAILLGNGLRNAFGGFVWDFEKADCRGPLCTAVCLEAFNESDGKSFELEADESFKTHPSPIIFDDIRMGCHYDARLEISGWAENGFDDSDWEYAEKCIAPSGYAKLCTAEPIRVYKEITPVEITHFDTAPFAFEHTEEFKPTAERIPDKRAIRHDVYVYDFGENNAGVTKLKINGKPGQRIEIRHMEYLANGVPNITNISFTRKTDTYGKYIEYAQKDVFICKGGEEVFVPKFKYDGFRYAYVEGLEPEQANTEALTFLVMASDLEVRSGFDSSSEVLNKLYEMTQRSDISNFYYFPTDCPQREKNGWTGDVSVSAEHMLLSYNAANSLSVWLDNVRMAQSAEGEIPGIVPSDKWGYQSYGPTWDSVCVTVPYYIYKFDGDKKVIEDNAEMILRYFYYQKCKYDKDGLIDYGLGDWSAPLRKNDGSFLSPRRFTSSAVAYIMANKAAFLFDEIGQKAEADYIRIIARDLRKNIRQHLIDLKSMTVAGDSQTSQALGIYAGLFDENEINTAGERLVDIIHKDGDINTCGVIGLRVIYHALTKIGRADLAYKLIVSEEASCYGAWVKAGATTLWESFPSDKDKRKMESQNHHFLGDISSWFVQDIAGLKVNSKVTDKSEFEISPQFIGELNYAKAYFDSFCGRIETEWRRIGDDIEIIVNVPAGMHGKIVLPGGYSGNMRSEDLECGCHRIIVKADKNI